MTKLFLRVIRVPTLPRAGKALLATDRKSEEFLNALEPSDIVTATVRKPRWPKHHRKYWVMLGLVHESSAVSDLYPTTQHLHDAIKGALGYWSEIRLPDGSTYKKVDSIAFESMDQTAFEEFYGKAVDLITTQIVPNLDREDLAREVEGMIK
ncbi:MAG: DUF1367 family protein [Geminicoccaceae bacterium]